MSAQPGPGQDTVSCLDGAGEDSLCASQLSLVFKYSPDSVPLLHHDQVGIPPMLLILLQKKINEIFFYFRKNISAESFSLKKNQYRDKKNKSHAEG